MVPVQLLHPREVGVVGKLGPARMAEEKILEVENLRPRQAALTMERLVLHLTVAATEPTVAGIL